MVLTTLANASSAKCSPLYLISLLTQAIAFGSRSVAVEGDKVGFSHPGEITEIFSLGIPQCTRSKAVLLEAATNFDFE